MSYKIFLVRLDTYEVIFSHIFENLNLIIEKNDKIGIFGSSGSGKTTLLNIILLLVEPSKGNLFVDGKKMTNADLDESV